jgi:hypothetical protein
VRLDISLVPLISEIFLDAGTHRNRALVHVAALGVRDTEQHKLLANVALVPLPRQHELAVSGVGQHSLHLDATRLFAVEIVALRGVHQETDTFLDGGLALLLRVLDALILGLLSIELQTKP